MSNRETWEKFVPIEDWILVRREVKSDVSVTEDSKMRIRPCWKINDNGKIKVIMGDLNVGVLDKNNSEKT